MGRLGESCKLPSGIWGEAPADIDFGVFGEGKTHLTAIDMDFCIQKPTNQQTRRITTVAQITQYDQRITGFLK